MTRLSASSALLAAAAAAAAVIVLWPAPHWTRMLTLPLALFLPGYALAAALFPGQIDWTQRVALSLGLSLATCVVGGVTLHAAVIGLTSRSWSVLLVATTVAGAIVAQVRIPRGDARPASDRVRVRWSAVIAVATACLLVAVAAGVARTPLSARGVRGYSALWMLGSDRSEASLRVGVISSELSEMAYRLEVRNGARTLWARRLTLEPGERWSRSVNVASIPTRRRSFVALLYRADVSRAGPAYRRATAVFPGSTFPATTLLWLYPVGTDRLHAGMISGQLKSTGFRVEIYAGRRLKWVRRLTLAPGEHWEATFDVRSVPRTRRSFEALLYRTGEGVRVALRRAVAAFPEATARTPSKRAVGGLGP